MLNNKFNKIIELSENINFTKNENEDEEIFVGYNIIIKLSYNEFVISVKDLNL
jgi:hypothetical protein